MDYFKRNNLKKILISIYSDKSGAVAVIIGICLVAFMIATALAVDIGSLFEDRRHLQTVADSAALAGAQELPENPEEARNIATEYANNNYSEEIESINVEISSTLATDDTITVTVFNPDSPLYFARVMDMESTPVGATATAIVASPRGAGSVVPWGLDEKYFDEWEPGTEYPLKFPEHQEPGDFMALDLDPNTGNPGGGASPEDYLDRIINGYDGLLYVGDTIYTQTGNIATTLSATEERIEELGDGWQEFSDITDPFEGGHKLVRADTQFVVVPIISLEGVKGTKPVVILGFATLVLAEPDPSNPGQALFMGTFVNRALIITEGSALDPVGTTGLRVVRLIQ